MYSKRGLVKTFSESWKIILITMIACITILMLYNYAETVLYMYGKARGELSEVDSLYYSKTGKHLT